MRRLPDHRLASDGDGPIDWQLGDYYLNTERTVGVSERPHSSLIYTTAAALAAEIEQHGRI